MTSMPALKSCPALAPVSPDRDLQILQITVNGCVLTGPYRGDPDDTTALDGAIWHLLKAFNYHPYECKGWIRRKPSARHCVSVKVNLI